MYTTHHGYDRVREHSSAPATQAIDQATEARIERLKRSGSAIEAGRRLADLDREWDIDRALMMIFSGVGGLTFSLGLSRVRSFRKANGWLYLFGAQLAFLGLHAAYGWCPPIAVLRRLGFRTQKEIQAEREIVEAIARSREMAGVERLDDV